MVLYGLGVSRGLMRFLHKEEYDFEEETRAAAQSGRDLALRRPTQYWVLGFKDRNLEEAYLNDLVVCERMPIYLGYIICSLLVAFGIFAYDVAGINTTTEDVLQNPNTKRDYGHSQLDTFQAMLDVVITLGALLVGLVFTVVIYRAPKIKRKSAILHIAESIFLIFIIFMGPSSAPSD